MLKLAFPSMGFSSFARVYFLTLSIHFGIFFDIYGEYYENVREFHQHLPKLLKPGGICSSFTGLCGGSAFFHLVYCHLVSLELENLGYLTQLIPLPVKDFAWEKKLGKVSDISIGCLICITFLFVSLHRNLNDFSIFAMLELVLKNASVK
ncbi:hypothetical protein SLA2020_143180 [Shorea laevis]